ncbi:MAG: ParB/RepB/Spo0J family partition protein [Ruminococcus flavefaciens]|nr:ParB/RepB/Spo0J family partition protein [Ruminococcus flavefaciens]MCM1228643.1 ParB/RepB/Spo0J family partition protein [Ruminococcus flavefaciens]
MAKGGLGAGLDSLFSDNSSEVQIKTKLRVSEIEPNRDQPRKYFSEEAISALAESIREHGMLQPILVRPLSTGNYQIVAGERRWRAARRLGLSEVPVNIREMSDIETAQIAIIENLQRENLNPIEEAKGYRDLIDKYGMTQEQIAKMIGKSRSAVANSIRILSLPEAVHRMIEDGDLSVGHAKALLAFEDTYTVVDLAEKACNGGMTVRQIEKLAQKENVPRETKSDKKIDNYFTEMEISLKERLGRKVKVDYGKNKGVLVLEFYDKDDLKTIAEKLAE